MRRCIVQVGSLLGLGILLGSGLGGCLAPQRPAPKPSQPSSALATFEDVAVLAGETGGLLVDVDDVEALADRMELLARNRALRQQLGRAARKRVAERYGFERRARELAAVYDQFGLCR